MNRPTGAVSLATSAAAAPTSIPWAIARYDLSGGPYQIRQHSPRHLWNEVYSDSTLVVPRRQGPECGLAALPTSSSTMQSLMIEMLEALDVNEDHRVLGIGTGAGYNVALSAHRIGGGNVVSIGIDPHLVALAKRRQRVASSAARAAPGPRRVARPTSSTRGGVARHVRETTTAHRSSAGWPPCARR